MTEARGLDNIISFPELNITKHVFNLCHLLYRQLLANRSCSQFLYTCTPAALFKHKGWGEWHRKTTEWIGLGGSYNNSKQLNQHLHLQCHGLEYRSICMVELELVQATGSAYLLDGEWTTGFTYLWANIEPFTLYICMSGLHGHLKANEIHHTHLQ